MSAKAAFEENMTALISVLSLLSSLFIVGCLGAGYRTCGPLQFYWKFDRGFAISSRRSTYCSQNHSGKVIIIYYKLLIMKMVVFLSEILKFHKD